MKPNSSREERLKKLFSEFSIKEVKPLAATLDAEERFPKETVEKMGKLGLMGLPYPREYGGANATFTDYILFVEELAKYCASTSVVVSAHTSLCCSPIYKFATKELKEKLLPDLLSGKKVGAFALTEPSGGTDAASQKSEAVKVDGGYILNGSKVFITNATDADVFVVFALTDRTKGVRGISGFVVERTAEGFKVGKKDDKLGVRGSATAELFFENVFIPDNALLGQEGKGFSIAMKALDSGRIGIAAQALGIAEGALEETINYTKERKQFGRSISSFQNTQFWLAELATKIEAARGLVYKAAKKAESADSYTLEAAMAKLFASQVANEVTTKAIQFHGGYGYTREYPVERMFRDAKVTEIYEGTSEVQRMVIASKII